jgi:type IV pilus assembly protein PilA
MFKKLGSKLKEQKGFTLIELLAVIVILGIIAAIAIPAISNVISKSETKATAQDGLTIVNAAKMKVANENVIVTTTFTKTQLGDYLDRVKATTEYTVTATKDASSGKFSYVLKVHPSVPSNDNDGLTEQELINAAK